MAEGEQVVETETVETVVTPEETAKPHPLEPGGERFNEVYARMKRAEEDASATRERLARLEGAQQAQRQPQQPMKFYSNDELQKLVDTGQINPATMADQIALQRQVQSEQRMVTHFQQQTRQQKAAAEVDQYISKLPKLNDKSSSEFLKVAQEAHQVAAEMGRPVEDPVVQSRALRTVYGSLDRLASVEATREFDRGHAVPTSEFSTGRGTPGTPKDAQTRSQDEALARVPKDWMAEWKRLGYSRERMLAEEKYIDYNKLKRKGIV